jgi:hypothetical protein
MASLPSIRKSIQAPQLSACTILQIMVHWAILPFSRQGKARQCLDEGLVVCAMQYVCGSDLSLWADVWRQGPSCRQQISQICICETGTTYTVYFLDYKMPPFSRNFFKKNNCILYSYKIILNSSPLQTELPSTALWHHPPLTFNFHPALLLASDCYVCPMVCPFRTFDKR